jgi:hypothetical protein
MEVSHTDDLAIQLGHECGVTSLTRQCRYLAVDDTYCLRIPQLFEEKGD